jgi:hypothetical protein
LPNTPAVETVQSQTGRQYLPIITLPVLPVVGMTYTPTLSVLYGGVRLPAAPVPAAPVAAPAPAAWPVAMPPKQDRF